MVLFLNLYGLSFFSCDVTNIPFPPVLFETSGPNSIMARLKRTYSWFGKVCKLFWTMKAITLEKHFIYILMCIGTEMM
jgi:hypothetical protein